MHLWHSKRHERKWSCKQTKQILRVRQSAGETTSSRWPPLMPYTTEKWHSEEDALQGVTAWTATAESKRSGKDTDNNSLVGEVGLVYRGTLQGGRHKSEGSRWGLWMYIPREASDLFFSGLLAWHRSASRACHLVELSPTNICSL